jgi:hypothetical protein
MERKYEYDGFQLLDGAGKLRIEWDGPRLDLYSIAILQLNLQEIVERVGFWIVSEAGLLYPLPGRSGPRRGWRGLPSWQPTPRFIRAVPDAILVGSLFQEVSFVIANVLADADMRAVLQNLAANVVWAIGASKVKGIRTVEGPPPPALRESYRERDPVEIGPNLRATVIALSEAVPHGSASISISSNGTTRDTQVRIHINNREG